MSKLTCPTCGNTSGWTNAKQKGNGDQVATCGNCNSKVKSKGGVRMGHVGSMEQTR